MRKFLVLFGLIVAVAALAGDESKCILPVNVNGSTSTAVCQYGVLADAGTYTGDGGCWVGNGVPAGTASCSGMTAVVQCNVDVYYDPRATQGGTASSSDYKIEFTNNLDPAYIYLRRDQSDIAFRAVSADGGCVLGISDRIAPRR